MFDYSYDPETGGLLLSDKTPFFSKEPRPVYAPELKILGIDEYWRFSEQDSIPYMWAEANRYYYRGELVFSLHGGSLYEAPKIVPTYVKDKGGNETSRLILRRGTWLKRVDVKQMVAKNKDLLSVLEQATLKKIYDVYKRYRKRVDCFHVAFSGGKDSLVLLELVKRALPKGSFIVVFGDTKMEFPDSYDVVNATEASCREDGVLFLRAESPYNPEQSWRIFGPPSRVIRWCCSVHKSAPQTILLRKTLSKNNYVGMDFLGVRSHESLARSGYEEESYGKKQRGQYLSMPILDWSSAEVWLYSFYRNLIINKAYTKGNSRVGCLFCPMSQGKAEYFRNISYPLELKKYINLIQDTIDDEEPETLISGGRWGGRRNGRDLKNNVPKYNESVNETKYIIEITNPSSDWRQWIKTIGTVDFEYSVTDTHNGIKVEAPATIDKTTSGRLFKQVFRKATHCIGCGVCEANCQGGCISFSGGRVKIDNCIHCRNCHDIKEGCLVYLSVKPHKDTQPSNAMKTINTLQSHAPEIEWCEDFFKRGNEFFESNRLGPAQKTKFNRFLTDAQLVKNGKVTSFYLEIVRSLGWESADVWALILINLVYENPQFRWYVNNMPIDSTFGARVLEEMVENEGASRPKDVVNAFKRFSRLPLCTELNFAEVNLRGETVVDVTRKKAPKLDSRVILYSLYRYAKAYGDYYQFTASSLMEVDSLSEGLSPVKLFGLTRNELEVLLRGLSARFEDYIDVSFTHDLDTVTLTKRDFTAKESNPEDILLELFRG